MRIQESNRGYSKRTIMDEAAKNLQKSENLFKLNKSMFKHMGHKTSNVNGGLKRSAFKNIK
jgi:hypothetical protein